MHKQTAITDKQVLELLRSVKAQVGSDFTGLGLIFYDAPLALPALALRRNENTPAPLPVARERVAEVLAKISSAENPWHDGFHFLDCDTQSITHLAQFVSPPVIDLEHTLPRRGGARHMTAALSSLVNGICCAALLTADGRANIYRRGQCTAEEALG